MSDKKIILVVDDTPENIQVMTSAIGNRYKVKASTSGEKALKICEADPLPDLILLDVMMPEMDGYEVCRRLKSDSRLSGIPVIFVTSVTDPAEEAKGRAAGAVDYIPKPIDPALVLKRIEAHI